MTNAHHFTFVPVWVIQDVLIYIVAAMLVFYIVKKEKQPISILMEMLCFTFLYASFYENWATVMGLYQYGRSIIMVFNVALSIPLFEYCVMYCALELMTRMQIPTWTKPILAGFFGVVADFSLDPVAVKQIYATLEGTIGRWVWYVNPDQVQIYNEPVMNFTGWEVMIAVAAVFFMLGRRWHQSSNYSSVVGYVYPVVASLVSLVVLVGFYPLTAFFMWLAPFGTKGSASEWVALIAWMVISVLLLVVVWRGRMLSRISFKEDFPLFLFLGGFPFVHLFFCIFGGFWEILWLVGLSSVVMWVLLAAIYFAGKRVPQRA